MKALLLLIIAFAPFVIRAQEINVKRSSLNLGGSSVSFAIDGHNYYLQQSIGQTIVGTFNNLNHIIRQGFVQPDESLYRVSEKPETGFSAYPIPVNHQLTVSLPDEISFPVAYQLIDLMGRELISGSISDTHLVFIDMNHIPSGSYLFIIRDRKRQHPFKVIKK